MRKSSLILLAMLIGLFFVGDIFAETPIPTKMEVRGGVSWNEEEIKELIRDSFNQNNQNNETYLETDVSTIGESPVLEVFDEIDLDSEEDFETMGGFLQQVIYDVTETLKDAGVVEFISGFGNDNETIDTSFIEALSITGVIENDISILTDEENRIVSIILDEFGDNMGNIPGNESDLGSYIENQDIKEDVSTLNIELIFDAIQAAVNSEDNLEYLESSNVFGDQNLTEYIRDYQGAEVNEGFISNLRESNEEITDQEVLSKIDLKIAEIKNNYNWISLIQRDLEGMRYVPGCEPGNDPEVASDGYKYAQINNQGAHVIPCSKRRFLEYIDNQKSSMVSSLLESQQVYKENYDRLWNKAVLSARNLTNTEIDADGNTTCLTTDGVETFDLGMGCINVKSLQMGGMAFGSDVGVVILDPFKCNNEASNEEIIECKESNNSFRVFHENGKILLKGMVYSSEYGPIMFDIGELDATIETLED